jgi:cell wall-associated NlpC family hydrolase
MLDAHEVLTVQGSVVTVTPRSGRPEQHAFDTTEEAEARVRVVREALTWVGTPFVDCADVKGPNGAVDCAMLLTRVFVDTGTVPPFDPRPYSPRWLLHRNEELFVKQLEDLGGVEFPGPLRLGDIVVWRFARTFSHGALVINADEVVHAYAADGFTTVTRRDAPLLTHVSAGSLLIARPVKFFSMWGK